MALRDLLAKFQIVSNPEALDKVNAALDKTKQKTRETGEQGAANLETLARGIEGIGQRLDAIIGFEVLRKFTELGERFAQMGERVKVTAESFGIGVEQWQKLGFAAEQSSVSNEQLAHSMMRLSRSLFEAKTGSTEAQETFARLGVPPGEISNLKSADQALLLLSTRLVNMKDPIEKLALVQKTLGRGSMEMVAFLSQGPGAIQAKMQVAAKDGLVLTEAQVNGLERMNHAIEKMEAKGRVILATFIEPMSKVVEQMVDGFIQIYNANKAWIDLNVEAFMVKIVYWMGFIFGFLETFLPRVKGWFGDKGMLGTLLGDAALLGTVVTGLAAISTSLQVINGIASAGGIYKLVGALSSLGGTLFGGAGAAGAAGAGVSSTGGLLGGGTAAASGGGLAAAGGVGLIGVLAGLSGYLAYKTYEDFKNPLHDVSGANVGKFYEKNPGVLMDTIPEGKANVDARSNITIQVSGAQSPEATAIAIRKEISDHHDTVMQNTMAALQGNKLGSQAIGSNNQ